MTLGRRGARLFSNANGLALSDKRFWPLYEAGRFARGGLLHPSIYPVGVEAMMDYMLMPLVGFLTDTSLARPLDGVHDLRL